MEREIGISTKADLSGVQALRKEMEAIRDLAREIAKNGVPLGRGPGGGATPQQMAMGQQVQQVVDARGQVLATSQGARGLSARLFHARAAQEGKAQQKAQTGSFSGSQAEAAAQSEMQNASIMAPGIAAIVEQTQQFMTPQQASATRRSQASVRGRAPSTPRASGTPRHIARAFSAIGSNTVFGNLNPFQQQEYGAAYQSWLAGDTTAPQAFFAEHGMAPQVAQGALAALSPRRSGGGTGPSGFGNAASGAMGALLGGDVGGALGGLASMLPYAAIAGGLLDFGISSFNSWQNQGLALSNISKQSLSAGDSLGKFMDAVDSAGAALGYLPQQVAQIANILSPALGNIGTAGLVNATQQTLAFSRAYGLSSSSVAQGVAAAAQMGLLQGPGSISQQSLQAMLGAMTYQGGMQGRTGQVVASLLQVMQAIEGRSVIPSGLGNVASQLTALSATGVRGLQGAAGAALLGQVASGMASPGLGPAGQALQYQALGLGSPFLTQFAQEMGPGYVLPSGSRKGQTAMQAILAQLQGVYGKARIGSAASGYVGLNQQSLVEESVLQGLWGVSMPQAGALLSVFGGGGTPSVMQAFNKILQASGGNLSGMPQENVSLLAQLSGAHNFSQLQAIAKQFRSAGGKIPAGLFSVRTGGVGSGALGLGTSPTYSFASAQRTLAEAIAGQKLNSLTQQEQVQSIKATIQNAQITVTGKVVQAFTPNQPPRPTPSHPYNPGRFGAQLDAYTGGSAGVSLASFNNSPGSNMLQWLFASGASSGGGIPAVTTAGWTLPASGGGASPSYFASRFKAAGVPSWIAKGIEAFEGHLSPSQYHIDTNGLASVGPLQINLGGQGKGLTLRQLLGNSSLQADIGIPPIAKAYQQGSSQGLTGLKLFEYVLGHSGHPSYAGLPSSDLAYVERIYQSLGASVGASSPTAQEIGAAVANALSPQFQALMRAIKGSGVSTHQTTSL